MHMLALFLDDNSVNPQMVPGILAAVAGFYLILFLVIAVILIIPAWFISKKAGFSPWLSLINIIPTFGGLVLLYVLAFSEWKVAPATAQVIAWQPPPPPAPPQPSETALCPNRYHFRAPETPARISASAGLLTHQGRFCAPCRHAGFQCRYPSRR